MKLIRGGENNMFTGLGGVFGWLLIIGIVGTLLNYIVKLVNKNYGKNISMSPNGKKVMKSCMNIFVRNHRFWGALTALLLLVHVGIQFSLYGFNGTGAIVGFLLVFQVCLGIYATVRKKPRKGAWFISHRGIPMLLIVGIVLHLTAPYSLNKEFAKEEPESKIEDADVSKLPILTLEELEKYNGENGSDAYVAYEGKVYDVTNHPKWSKGQHNGNVAGSDLTDKIKNSPHGASKFDTLEVVGTIQ